MGTAEIAEIGKAKPYYRGTETRRTSEDLESENPKGARGLQNGQNRMILALKAVYFTLSTTTV
jgi:hypothetical protein